MFAPLGVSLALLLLQSSATTSTAFVVRERHSQTDPSSLAKLFSSTSSVPSLYDVQEEAITRRGEFEEELMRDTSIPIEEYIPVLKGANSGGGFGGGATGKSSSKSSNKKPKAPPKSALKALGKAFAKVLLRDGVVRTDHVLPQDLADDLREYVLNLRATAEQQVADGSIAGKRRFANVLLRHNRCDLTMPLGEPIIYDALHYALNLSPVGVTLAELLGKDAVLYEFSCLISDPGSPRQVMHPDTPCRSTNEEPVLYTCFFALQDVKLDMGPTVWLPGTHTLEFHELFKKDAPASDDPNNPQNPKDQLLKKQPGVLGTLPKGACGMYDSRILHAGTANKSGENGTKRAIFYFSWKKAATGYPGNPASIRRELQEKLQLDILQNELQQYAKQGQPTEFLQRLAASLR